MKGVSSHAQSVDTRRLEGNEATHIAVAVNLRTSKALAVVTLINGAYVVHVGTMDGYRRHSDPSVRALDMDQAKIAVETQGLPPAIDRFDAQTGSHLSIHLAVAQGHNEVPQLPGAPWRDSVACHAP